MTGTLKKDTIKGVFWSFIDRFGTQFILLITQIVLARLLTPEDFGLIGMLSIFIAVSQVFVDSGFGNALIQKKDANQTDYSTVFYFNIGVGFLLYGILFFSAPYIASFFQEEKLIGLTRLIGLLLIFNSLGLIQFVKFKKDLDFKSIAKATMISNVIAAILGIMLAFLNFGVWALALQMVCIYFFRSLLFWILSMWRPTWEFSYISFKGLFNFGSKLLLSGLLDQIFQNVYLLIIGKLFSTKDLGYYTQAKKFQDVPVTTLAAIVGNVTFPAFSKIQDDKEKLLIGFRKTLKLLVFVNFPLMLGLAVVAQPFFLFVFGPQWLPSVPYFQLLCISGMVYTLHTTNLSILQVKGRSDLFLRLEIIKKGITVIAIFIGLQWGIMGLIYGRVVTSFIGYFINAHYSGELLNYPILNQLKDLSPSMMISIIMAILMITCTYFLELSISLFLLQICIGIISYFLISYFTKQEALIDGLKIIKEFIPLNSWKTKKY
ncbi:MOP flippase family protein [Ancylomarina sp. 16SWW S1-10-2]|uniref:MOP flippase family protein n=1 Tax=Ancylomarina sp. 16SWW S1-10-2 TaxID=2499681 RepID=UPI0012AD3A91|nr:MOP flippase family protein [Ancylomarina sp. 16SWW S1-10-2]MRT94812.1 colanic acid exporter [Ancylomarina sp. 16SWW S1-10-2]